MHGLVNVLAALAQAGHPQTSLVQCDCGCEVVDLDYLLNTLAGAGIDVISAAQVWGEQAIPRGWQEYAARPHPARRPLLSMCCQDCPGLAGGPATYGTLALEHDAPCVDPTSACSGDNWGMGAAHTEMQGRCSACKTWHGISSRMSS